MVTAEMPKSENLVSMKVVEITQPGDPQVLQLAERPVPKAGQGEVLIKVRAAGVNRPDVAQRQGAYPPPKGASDLPGLEVCGEIVDGDLSGSDLKKGDLVCALTPGGGYAEYVKVPVGHCLPVPKGLSEIEAAGIPENYFTVWSNVFERGALKSGESLLVHGGSSGIGTTAIQLAVARGSKVYATAGSDKKVETIEKLGAVGINYKTSDFYEELKKLTDKKGVNVVLDMVAGDYTNQNIKILAEDGRLVTIATLGGPKVEINMGLVMVKRLIVTGSTLRPRSVEYKTQVAQALQREVWPLLESGKVKPLIYKTFDYKDAANAHELMESSEHIGKIILTF